MRQKKKLKIDLEDLAMAMQDNSYELEYFLDLESGEVLLISDDLEETDQIREQVEEFPERYESVPKADSSEAYRDMQDFIATVENERLAGMLEVAIEGKGAFRRFKDVLLRFPEERERWISFSDARERERVLQWLEAIGVEPA